MQGTSPPRRKRGAEVAPRPRAAGAGGHALEVPHTENEPLVKGLHWVIRMAVRALAILMTGVIAFGVADVVYVLYRRLMADPRGFLQISDILATFGAFMAVLIAIEIFVNIISYLREDVIHVRIVLATAMMAIARKVDHPRLLDHVAAVHLRHRRRCRRYGAGLLAGGALPAG